MEKLKIEFETFLLENLTYPVISDMNFEEYKSFVFDVFRRLNELKNLGINKQDIGDFVQKLFTEVMDVANDSDIMFERRFSSITEEIYEFCPDPFFWNTDFDIYMKKWDRGFQTDWFKSIEGKFYI